MEKAQPHFWTIPGLSQSVKLDYDKLVKQKREQCFKTVKETIFEHFPFINKGVFHRKSPSGKKPVGTTNENSVARHLFFYMCKEILFPTVSLKTIGAYIYPNFDHGSVIYGINRIKDRLYTKEITQEQIDDLKKDIIAKLKAI